MSPEALNDTNDSETNKSGKKCLKVNNFICELMLDTQINLIFHNIYSKADQVMFGHLGVFFIRWFMVIRHSLI